MALDFENVRLLTYSHTPVFMDAGLRFKVQQNFTIEGTLLTQSNTDGVNATWTKAQALQLLAQDYQPITLNGNTFGNGKITNINFIEGNDVQEQKYQYQISAFIQGNLFNAVSNEFAGINWEGNDATGGFRIECVDRVDETFSYQNTENGDQSYDQSISVKFNRDPSNLGVSPIAFAQSLATNFMSALGLAGFLGTYSNLSTTNVATPPPAYKTTHVENYDVVDFSCSFSVHVDIPSSQATSLVYSIDRVFSIQRNEIGIVTASEKGVIKGLMPLLSGSATTGFQTEVPNDATVYNRVNTVFAAYDFSNLGLNSTLVNKVISINKFTGEIEYTYTFTNDPKYLHAISSYTIEMTRSIENYITITQSGTIIGIGRPWIEKYQNALTTYTTNISPNILSNIQNAYNNEMFGTHYGYLTQLKSSFAGSVFNGEISYSQVYTDNPMYYTGSSLIRKQEIEVTTDMPVQLVYNVPVINTKEVIQPLSNSSLGKCKINMKLRGSREAVLSDYLSFATNFITTNGYNNIGTDNWVSSCQYSLTPLKNSFAIEIEFIFDGFYKAFEDLTLTTVPDQYPAF